MLIDRTIEQNLDAISRTPKIHREELLKYVHLPEMTPLVYNSDVGPKPTCLKGLFKMYISFVNDPQHDPYVIQLRSQHSEDSKTSKKIQKAMLGKTNSQEELKRLLTVADEVHKELGGQISNYYIQFCVDRMKGKHSQHTISIDDLGRKEYAYLCEGFSRFLPELGFDLYQSFEELSPKAQMLVDLLYEKIRPGTAGIVFVQTRAVVHLIFMLLSRHPKTRESLRVGTYVGTSNNYNKTSRISDIVDAKSQSNTLDDLRTGAKNLIISTSICEEGIDISACNIVVCFETPPNLKSFIQRRGRARKAESQYIIMFQNAACSKLDEWTVLEEEMKALYRDEMRILEEVERKESAETGYREYTIESTGYVFDFSFP